MEFQPEQVPQRIPDASDVNTVYNERKETHRKKLKHPKLKETVNQLLSEKLLPDISWSRKLSNVFPPIKDFEVGWKDGAKLAMLGWRMWKYVRRERAAGRIPIMNPFNTPLVEPLMGVPIGGIGGGSITRGWRGDFVRWNISPCGMTQTEIVETDQFSFYVKRKDPEPNSRRSTPVSSPRTSPKTPRIGSPKPRGSPKLSRSVFNLDNNIFTTASVLNPGFPKKNTKLADWNWEVTGEWSTYHATFPRSWTVYEEPDPTIRLVCKQISPVIPHNYKESSYPCGVFVWTIENTGKTEAEVSLMFTFQNGMGTAFDVNGGHVNTAFNRKLDDDREAFGVSMSHKMPQSFSVNGKPTTFEDPLTFAIAALHDTSEDPITITYCTKFSSNHSPSIQKLWQQFSSDGTVSEIEDASLPSEKGKSIAGAVAAKMNLGPGVRRQLVFAVAWDNPIVRFQSGCSYFRRYTSFFGESGNSVQDIISEALLHYQEWEEEIEKWQNPILNDPHLPDFYKAALFNELYYIVDGGTIWTTKSKTNLEDIASNGTAPHVDEDIGHFAYLESLEYLMYNTYDVHFYASFALAMLWPKLELSLQRDVAIATLKEYKDQWQIMHSGKFATRKAKGAVPHDMGNPGEDPWNKVNSYCIQDISRWKDLPCKFVLQVYRDYVVTGDLTFLKDLWPVIKETIEYAKQFDLDGDGVLDNEKFPDQTYDTWPAEGCSAYCGGLWLACLGAAQCIATLMKEHDTAFSYGTLLHRAKKSYNDKLWNGQYYNYDASTSPHHDSIMADQMAGHWYSKACGLGPVVPESNAYLALKTIYEMNVKSFKGGKLGAINGMRPDGSLDTTCMQSVEVWTGTTYAAAAAMLQQGMVKEAFETIKGIIIPTYQEIGYMFQTPEAWDVKGQYRSAAYMRPLVIWAIQWGWERFCNGENGFESSVLDPLRHISINDPLEEEKCKDIVPKEPEAIVVANTLEEEHVERL